MDPHPRADRPHDAARRFCYHRDVHDMLTDVVQWDVANWSAALDYWAAHAPLHGTSLDALEIGANSGGLSLWLARAGHRVVCSDLERTREHAAPLIERHGMLDRVVFEDIDATAIPYENHFDIIVFKSVLGGVGHDGAIERQRAAISSMHAALKPGGMLLFAENLTGSAMHRFLRSRYVRWGDRWRYVTIDEMRDFLKPFRNVAFETAGFFGTLGRSESQRRVLAAIDRAGVTTLVPPSWRYLVFGVAVK
ncbi:MAG TPA: class I SAM-dependent methyltransferase [Candidatus Baltobacteraceae bacterium]|nr:class I SAM-dependent methyltransferase [Candidatus Baltobacteraceae bacterium]